MRWPRGVESNLPHQPPKGMKLPLNQIVHGNALEVLKTFPDECVDCVVTSPPYYGLRDYGVAGQVGLEPTLEIYLDKMLQITKELFRVLKKTGTLWWNHGDSYNGTKVGNTETIKNPKVVTNTFRKEKQPMQEKSLLLQAHRLAIRMVDEQRWILRNQIIWHKPNVMPSSVKDRFTVDYEPVFFFTKSKRYWFEPQIEALALDSDVKYRQQIRKGREYNCKRPYKNNLPAIFNLTGRNKRCVWKIPTQPYPEAHFATFPKALIETPIKAGCPPEGTVLDPFMGSGTTALTARNLGRNFMGIELNGDYIKLAEKRLAQQVMV